MTTILIVEDEALVAEDLAGKLRGLGYGVAGIAMEGEEAIALAESLHPHLVLMDIWLAGSMDGIEAAEAIRSRIDVPVIYLTAHSDSTTLARAKLTGPFGYILKPFEERELATQIELALHKHQADQQLREQRELLRVTLTSIGDAVIATDAKGYITFINPVAESLTGWKAVEATGLFLTEVFHVFDEQTGEHLDELGTRVFREGGSVPLGNHAALVTRDGRTMPIEGRAAPIKDACGQVIGSVLVFQDVTEKRRAREALLESENRFRALFDQAPIPYQSLDEEGLILMVNQAWVDALGYTREEVIGTWFGSYLAAPCVKTFIEKFPCFKGQGEISDVEFELLRKDGRHILVSFNGRIGREGDGTFKQTHCIFVDITERKRSEQELKITRAEALKEKNRLEAVMEALPIGVAIIDSRGGIIKSNPSYEQVWGSPRPEARTVGDYAAYNAWWVETGRMVQPEEWASARAIQKGERVIGQLMQIARFDGNRAFVHNSAAPVFDGEGRIAGSAVAIMDITQQIEAELAIKQSRDELELRVRERTAALEKANEQLRLIPSRLIAAQEEERKRLACELHDSITQTLVGLKYGIEVVLIMMGQGHTAEALQHLDRFVPTLQRSIEESRAIYMGMRPSVLEDIGLIAAIQWLKREFNKFYPEHHIELEMDISEDDVSEILKISIFRICQEALNNVAKHSKAQCVDISLAHNGTSIELVVADDGAGMDSSYIESSAYATSLGLTGMRERAELTAGSFTIESNPGEGTAIRVVWPLEGL